MFPQVNVVKNNLSKMYTGTCDVIQHTKTRTTDGSTKFTDETLYSQIPCRLSNNTFSNGSESDSATEVNKVIKVFMDNDYTIPSGSKIVITQNGVTNEYKSSSIPAVHEAHQEIVLEIFKGWS